MTNLIGKALVLVTVGLSLVFFSFALGLFFNKVDWGRKEPRVEVGQRIPAEIDKRTAAANQALRARDRARQRLDLAQKKLAGVERNRGDNYLWYAAELDRLLASPGDIEVHRVKMHPAGAIPPGEPVYVADQQGRPVLDPAKVTYVDAQNQQPVELTKSLAVYSGELWKLQAKLGEISDEIRKSVAMQKDLTEKLNGVTDKDGAKLRPGLYDLLENEVKTHERLKEELAHVRPLWVRELVDAQLLVNRRYQLEQRLQELGIPAGAKND